MADGYPLNRAGSDAATWSAEADIAESRRQPRVCYFSPETLFTSQNDSLVRALTFSCGDPGLAEDSVQEAFARLLVNWDRVAKYDNPATWVRRVALNLAHDHRRSVLRHVRLLNLLGHRPGSTTYSIQGNPRLWTAVRELPERQRTALSLYYLGDLKVVEVAEAMGVTPGTVKGYLDRARETLRKKLEMRDEL